MTSDPGRRRYQVPIVQYGEDQLKRELEFLNAYNRGLNAGKLRQARAIVEKHRELFLEMGMTIVTIDIQPRVVAVAIADDKLVVTLEDGRAVLAPLAWYPRLLHATRAERSEWRVLEDTNGRDVIFWEQPDELIPVVALLAGVPSRESARSLERWLAARRASPAP